MFDNAYRRNSFGILNEYIFTEIQFNLGENAFNHMPFVTTDFWIIYTPVWNRQAWKADKHRVKCNNVTHLSQSIFQHSLQGFFPSLFFLRLFLLFQITWAYVSQTQPPGSRFSRSRPNLEYPFQSRTSVCWTSPISLASEWIWYIFKDRVPCINNSGRSLLNRSLQQSRWSCE